MTKRLNISDSDYEEVINGLDVVMSDRCCSQSERDEVQAVIDRIQCSWVPAPDENLGGEIEIFLNRWIQIATGEQQEFIDDTAALATLVIEATNLLRKHEVPSDNARINING